MSLSIELKKPLVFLDIEATGLNVTKDRIIELSLIKLSPNGSEEKKTWKINPEVEIPENIVELTGISNESIKDMPLFKDLVNEINHFITGCDFAGFDIYRLDLPLLMEEYERAGHELEISKRKIVDVQRIFHFMEKRNLAAAYQFYCGKELLDSHGAEQDASATYEVFKAQIERYPQLGNTVEEISKSAGNPAGLNVDIVGRMVMNESGEEIFNFGKYRGQKVTDVLKKDPNFYNWMMNGDFPSYTKKKLTEIRLRMKTTAV